MQYIPPRILYVTTNAIPSQSAKQLMYPDVHNGELAPAVWRISYGLHKSYANMSCIVLCQTSYEGSLLKKEKRHVVCYETCLFVPNGCTKKETAFLQLSPLSLLLSLSSLTLSRSLNQYANEPYFSRQWTGSKCEHSISVLLPSLFLDTVSKGKLLSIHFFESQHCVHLIFSTTAMDSSIMSVYVCLGCFHHCGCAVIPFVFQHHSNGQLHSHCLNASTMTPDSSSLTPLSLSLTPCSLSWL